MAAWWNDLSIAGQVFACMAIPATILMVIQIILQLVGMTDHHDIGSDTSGIGDGGHDFDTSAIDAHDFDPSAIDGHDFDSHGFDGHHDFGDGHDMSGHAHSDMHMEEHTHDGHHGGHAHDHGLRLFTVRGIIIFFALFGWTALACLRWGLNVEFGTLIGMAAGFLGMLFAAWIIRESFKLAEDGTLKLQNAVGKTATVYLRIPPGRSGKGKISLTVQDRLIEVEAVTDSDVEIATNASVRVVGVADEGTLVVAMEG